MKAKEKLGNPEKKIGLKESLALQTYEFFDGGPERVDDVAAFCSGESTDLALNYPGLTGNELDVHLYNLRDLKESDEFPAIATQEYRLAEAYFLLASRRLCDRGHELSQSEINNFQILNEAIYGIPNPEVVDSMLANLWSRLDRIDVPELEELKNDLLKGSVFKADDGSSVEIPGLPRPELLLEQSLPELSDEALDWLKEEVISRYEPVKTLFQTYHEAASDEKCETGFDAHDIHAMFEEAASLMGLDVAIILKEHATLLSWSSADRAVVIGENRKPIKSVDELFGLFVHEAGVHGTRYIRGISTGIDELGVGVFTEADAGEDPSYLTFEEGLASTLQLASRGKKELWSMAGMGLYLNVALAHQGWSPRQIHEVMTKVRVVLAAGSKKDPFEINKEYEKAEKASVGHVVRVFRGTPVELKAKTSEGISLHYAKDLAYANGKIKAINYLNSLAQMPEEERSRELDLLLFAKFDPTNHRQKEIVEAIYNNDKVEV